MIILFWFSFAAIMSTYFIYPIFLLVFSFLLKKSHIKKDIEPKVSLIIPAYNEEKVISKKIENSLLIEYAKDKLEILIVLDECTDKTKEIAERYLTKGIRVIEQKPRKGKMAALNLAVFKATGDIIVFSDADIVLDVKAVKYLVENFADEKIGCVGGELHYISGGDSLIESGESLYFKYDKFIRNHESKMQTLFVVSGSIYAIRKGLFRPIRDDLADDFINPVSISSQGYGVIYDQRAKAFGRIARTVKEEYGQKVRMVTQGFHGSTQLFRFISKNNVIYIFEFLFHKFIRWLVPVFLIMMFIASLYLVEIAIFKIALIGQVIFYILGITGYYLHKKNINTKIFYIPFYFMLVNYSSLVGLLKFLTGDLRATWEKAETTRG